MRIAVLLQDFTGKAAVSFVFRFLGLGLQFATSILLARLLGVDDYGAYAYAFTWATLFGMMLTFGMSDLAVRELPAFLVHGKFGHARGYLLSGLAIILSTGAVSAAALYLLERNDILRLAPGWRLVALVAVVHGGILMLSQGMNGLQRILTSQFLESVVRQALYLCLILALSLGGVAITVPRLFELACLVALPILLTMGWIILSELASAEADCPGRSESLATEPVLWITAALPLMLTNFAQIMQSDLDTLMVGLLRTEAEVGVYRIAARGAALVSIATMVSLQLLGPMLSRALSRQEHDLAQSLIGKAALLAAASGLAISLPLGFGATAYTWLFGPDFADAALPLRLLLVGQMVHVFAGPSALLLVMLRRERLVLLINGGAVTLNFGLNIVLIPVYGIFGAAIATLVAAVFSGSLFLVAVLRATEFDPTIFGPLKSFVRPPKG